MSNTHTPTTTLAEWHAATADLRKEIFATEYPKALDAIMSARKGKVKSNNVTETQRQKARNTANGIVTSKLYRMDEVNGVRNPVADDEVWGPNSTGITGTTTEDLKGLADWLAEQTWSEFAVSLADQYRRKGTLSEKQVASAKSMRTKVEKRQAERKAQDEAAAKRTDGLDLSNLPSGLYAVPEGDTRLKVKIDNVEKGKWEGFVFVKDANPYGSQKRYGMQRPGTFYRGEIEEALKAIVENPLEAIKAYGRLTGTCGRCSRPLTDETSVAEGIGPICANSF